MRKGTESRQLYIMGEWWSWSVVGRIEWVEARRSVESCNMFFSIHEPSKRARFNHPYVSPSNMHFLFVFLERGAFFLSSCICDVVTTQHMEYSNSRLFLYRQLAVDVFMLCRLTVYIYRVVVAIILDRGVGAKDVRSGRWMPSPVWKLSDPVHFLPYFILTITSPFPVTMSRISASTPSSLCKSARPTSEDSRVCRGLCRTYPAVIRTGLLP